MHELEQLVIPLINLCSRAGEQICAHYHSTSASAYESKEDNSPLTQADLDSHRILLQGLAQLEPALPVLSEESSAQEILQRFSWERYWLVDPLDGTKEFLARTGEFTINLAYIDGHQATLGILYVPLQRQAYVGIAGGGAWRYTLAADGSWEAQALRVRSLDSDRPLVVLSSRRHGGRKLEACLEYIASTWGQVERRNSGSAIKFCRMVDGEGDFYPRFAPCSEWDTAAGQAILEAAGGALLGLDGKPLQYNMRDTLLNPDFVAISDAGHSLWPQMLKHFDAAYGSSAD